MNNITWEYLLEILQYTQDYQDCLQLLITCKTFYNNKQLNKLIKQFYTNIFIDKHGDKYYYFNDKRHRRDGPAIIDTNGNKFWYQNGKLYRTDGPAIESFDGTAEWRVNFKLHRIDGPAIEYYNGIKEWYINGIQYTYNEFNQQIKKLTK